MWNCIHVAQAGIYQQHYWGWQMQTVHMNVQSHTSRIYTVITMKLSSQHNRHEAHTEAEY